VISSEVTNENFHTQSSVDDISSRVCTCKPCMHASTPSLDTMSVF